MAKAACLRFLLVACFCILIFAKPLFHLARFTFGDDLFSYVCLIPFLSAYLVWEKRRELDWKALGSSPGLGLVTAAVGLVSIGVLELAMGQGWRPARQDWLFVMMFSFVAVLVACGFFIFGRRFMGALGVPFALLFFLAPLPAAVERGLEAGLQWSSALAAEWLFRLAGTSVVRNGLILDLPPAITLEVGRECSGIRSSLILIVTSLAAAYLFLKSPWRRTVLVFAAVPVAILRNGFRIFTIGMLCAHVDPEMIHSWVHQRGGPLFFVLSLIPMLGLILALRRGEAIQAPVPSSPGATWKESTA